MTTQRVTLAYCHPGWVAADFMESLLGLRRSDVEFRLSSIHTGPLLARARNILTADFLANSLDDHSEEWLWMVDTDMSFRPEILERLLSVADRDERPIVGGLYFGPCPAGHSASGTLPVERAFVSDEEIAPLVWQEVEGRWRVWVDYPRNSLVRVGAAGGGCLLIHRRVLEEIGADWFTEVIDGEHFSSEDLAFCARARVHGFPIHVHTGITLGHRKPDVIDEQTYLRAGTSIEIERIA